MSYPLGWTVLCDEVGQNILRLELPRERYESTDEPPFLSWRKVLDKLSVPHGQEDDLIVVDAPLGIARVKAYVENRIELPPGDWKIVPDGRVSPPGSQPCWMLDTKSDTAAACLEEIRRVLGHPLNREHHSEIECAVTAKDEHRKLVKDWHRLRDQSHKREYHTGPVEWRREHIGPGAAAFAAPADEIAAYLKRNRGAGERLTRLLKEHAVPMSFDEESNRYFIGAEPESAFRIVKAALDISLSDYDRISRGGWEPDPDRDGQMRIHKDDLSGKDRATLEKGGVAITSSYKDDPYVRIKQGYDLTDKHEPKLSHWSVYQARKQRDADMDMIFPPGTAIHADKAGIMAAIAPDRHRTL